MSEVTQGESPQRLPAQTGPINQAGERDGPVVWYYWRVIWNRRWVIVGVFITVSIIVGIRVFRSQPVYKATGTMAIEPARQQVVVGIQGFTPGDQSVYEGRLIQMQLDILQSRRLAERVIDRLKLGEYPEFARSPAATEAEKEKQRSQLIDAFLARLNVERPKDDLFGKRVIRVSFSSTDPRLAAQVVNRLFETFIDYNREENARAVEFAADWLTKQLAELEGKVQKSKDALLKYQQSTELLNPGETDGKGESNPALERFGTLNTQLAEAESARISAEILLRLAREGGPEALPGTVSDPLLEALKQERAKREAELSQLRTVYQDTASPVKQLQQQLAGLDDRIKQAKQTQVERIEKEYRLADERVRALTATVEKQRAEILKQNRDALQFNLLKRETDVDEKLFQMLSERLREAGLMRSLTPNSNIRIIDRAETPLLPTDSKRSALLVGAIMALALGLGLGFLLEYLDDSVKTVEDVERLLKLPSLGLIPWANGGSDRPLLLRKRSRGPAPIMIASENGTPAFTEAYRTLRTSVLLSSAGRPPRTVVITSNEMRVGKTTTAVNTAIAFSQAGKRVLLIDGDMRHPGCASAFGIDNATGLSTYLSFDDTPAAFHRISATDGLDLLPSGPIPPNPSELLSSERIRALIESVVAQYDHIIIDTPPVGVVSDALILAALVDGVILVVRAEETSRRGVLRAKDALHNVSARILGVVLNAVDWRRHQDGYYGYGYGYGYGYFSSQTPKAQKSNRLKE
jgi:capsular exopolysaccharide synthesis family protein